MNREDVLAGVKECLAGVVDIDVGRIKMESRIIEDLGADSLDLLDLVFQLEQRFKVKIAPRDLERRAKEKLGDTPLEVGGVYTPQALEHLREAMPEVPAEELAEGVTTADLPRRFRVASMVNLVMRIQEENSG